MCYWPA